MKRAILKKLMMTLVITLLLFNNGIQGMEENLLEKDESTKIIKELQNELNDFNDTNREMLQMSQRKSIIDDYEGEYIYDDDPNSDDEYQKLIKNTLNTVGSMDITGPTENKDTSDQAAETNQLFGKFLEPYFRKKKLITDDIPYVEQKNTKTNILSDENPANLNSQLNIHNYEEMLKWIEQLDEHDKSKLETMIIDAKQHDGTFSKDAIQTEFDISLEKAEAAIEWYVEIIKAEKNTENLVKSARRHDIKMERFPTHLRKDKHVLIQLENPKNDLLKTLLMFANPEVYAQSVWTNEVIKTEFEYYLNKNKDKNIAENPSNENSNSPLKELLKMQKNGQCIWEEIEGMKYIIDLIPDVFKITIAKYGMNRKMYMYKNRVCEKKKTQPKDNLQKTYPILTISDGHGNFYPVRRVQDLKEEFETSNVQFENVTFSPFIANGDPIEKSVKQDYLNLAKAISVSPYYNPYKDHREKLDISRDQLKRIKDNIENYLHCTDQEYHWITKKINEMMGTDNWETYSRQNSDEWEKDEEDEQKQDNEELGEPKTQKKKKDKPDFFWPVLPEDLNIKLEIHDIYGLKKCFDIYLFDDKNEDNSWLKLDNVIFQKIMENCRTFKVDGNRVIRNEKMTAEVLINFYYWYKHKLVISHKDIEEHVNALQNKILLCAAGTFVSVVVPCCSAWKSMYMSLHPGESIYDINLGLYPTAVASYWSIYLFIYFGIKNPFLNHDIDACEYKPDSKKDDDSKSCIAKCKSYYNTRNCVDQVVFLRPLRSFVAKALCYVNDWLNARNLKSLTLVYFIVTTIAYTCLKPIRSVFELTQVIPSHYPFYKELIHAPLQLAKVFALTFGGKTVGFGIANIDDVHDAGEFLAMTYEFFGTKMIVLLLLTPAFACAKLLKVIFIAFGTAIGNYRCCAPLVKGFKKLCHTKYNHAQHPIQFFGNNLKPICSKFGIAVGVYAFTYIFTDKWIQEDISDISGGCFGLVIWDFAKYTTNMLNHQLHTVSEYNYATPVKNPAKRFGNFIKRSNTQFFLTIYTVFSLIFYSYYGLDTFEYLQYVGELFLEVGGYYFYFFVPNIVYLVCKAIGHRFANYQYPRIDDDE